MIGPRGLIVFLAACAALIAICGHARAADCPAPERMPSTCAEVRACIIVAGGLENAKRVAGEQGHSKIKIEAVAKLCGLKG